MMKGEENIETREGLSNLVELSTPYYLPSNYEEKERQDQEATRGQFPRAKIH